MIINVSEVETVESVCGDVCSTHMWHVLVKLLRVCVW